MPLMSHIKENAQYLKFTSNRFIMDTYILSLIAVVIQKLTSLLLTKTCLYLIFSEQFIMFKNLICLTLQVSIYNQVSVLTENLHLYYYRNRFAKWIYTGLHLYHHSIAINYFSWVDNMHLLIGLFQVLPRKERRNTLTLKSSLKSVTHTLLWWNLAQLYFNYRRSKKYMNHSTHPGSSADIKHLYRKSAIFVISRNTDKNCILTNNFYF